MSDQPNQPQLEKETPYVSTDREPPTKFYWENLARLRGPAATTAKEYLASRDGRKCWVCGAADETLNLLEFHHLDRNTRENHRWNLRLVHHPCNTMVYHRDQKSQPLFTGRGRARESRGVPSEALSDSEPDTIRLNKEYEDEYRRYVVAWILSKGPDPSPEEMEFLVPKNVHDAACEWTGCNPKTGYPYMGRMVNPINGFIKKAKWRTSGRQILVFTNLSYYDLSLEQIVERHPKQGLRLGKQVRQGDDELS